MARPVPGPQKSPLCPLEGLGTISRRPESLVQNQYWVLRVQASEGQAGPAHRSVRDARYRHTRSQLSHTPAQRIFSPDSLRISNPRRTKAPKQLLPLCLCESGADPGEDGGVTGSEARRWRGGPGVSLPAGPAFGKCHIKGQGEAAVAKPPFPPTSLIRMKMGRCAREGAASAPRPR